MRDRHRTGELTLHDGDGESATDSNMMATQTRTLPFHLARIGAVELKSSFEKKMACSK